VFVGNLHYETTSDELVALLSEAGSVVDVHLPTDRATGRPRGFAFVGFSSDASAAEAIRRFNTFEMRGRRLVVNPADERPRPAAGPRFAVAGPPPDSAGFGGGRGPERRFKSKGSRRGLRRRKRSL